MPLTGTIVVKQIVFDSIINILVGIAVAFVFRNSTSAKGLEEEKNPLHCVRVEYNAGTILVHLSNEDGKGWTVRAVDRKTRKWAVAQESTQLSAASNAFDDLYSE
jgi:hypothetical protein